MARFTFSRTFGKETPIRDVPCRRARGKRNWPFTPSLSKPPQLLCSASRADRAGQCRGRKQQHSMCFGVAPGVFGSARKQRPCASVVSKLRESPSGGGGKSPNEL